jgi:phosphoenolpyruvate carboxylase
VESRIAAAKEHALSQTASIDALFKTLDDTASDSKRVRLDLDKLVTRRKVEVKEQLPPPPEVIIVTETFSLGGDIKSKKDRINKAFHDAEIKMSFASHETIHLEVQRKNLMEKVAEIDAKISKWRQEIDEAQQAMDVLLSLVDAPDAVIDMVL